MELTIRLSEYDGAREIALALAALQAFKESIPADVPYTTATFADFTNQNVPEKPQLDLDRDEDEEVTVSAQTAAPEAVAITESLTPGDTLQIPESALFLPPLTGEELPEIGSSPRPEETTGKRRRRTRAEMEAARAAEEAAKTSALPPEAVKVAQRQALQDAITGTSAATLPPLPGLPLANLPFVSQPMVNLLPATSDRLSETVELPPLPVSQSGAVKPPPPSAAAFSALPSLKTMLIPPPDMEMDLPDFVKFVRAAQSDVAGSAFKILTQRHGFSNPDAVPSSARSQIVNELYDYVVANG